MDKFFSIGSVKKSHGQKVVEEHHCKHESAPTANRLRTLMMMMNRRFVSCLIFLCEMSVKAIQFYRVTFYPYKFGSIPNCLRETFLESVPNWMTFESDPVWVRIANPNGFRSVGSRANARPDLAAVWGYESI